MFKILIFFTQKYILRYVEFFYMQMIVFKKKTFTYKLRLITYRLGLHRQRRWSRAMGEENGQGLPEKDEQMWTRILRH